MIEPMSLVIGLAAGVAAGVVPVLFILRGRIRAERSAAAVELQASLQAEQARREAAAAEAARLRSEAEAFQKQSQESAARCAAAESTSQQLQKRIEELRAEAKTCADRLEQLQSRLQAREADISGLQTLLNEERKQAEEKLRLLSEARDQLKTEFQNLANAIFEEKGRTFAEQNKTNLDLLLKPLQEQIGQFRDRVETTHIDDVKGREQLLQRIQTLTELNQLVGKEAQNLTTAIKGEAKVQGNWGEVVLERALEISGLKEGVEYERQMAGKDEDGNTRYLDVVVHLPESRDVVIDSKVSLTAYERYVAAESDEARTAALDEHAASVRRHVDELHEKKYESLPGIRSLDFVLMFMHIEPAFAAAIRHDPDLFEYAFKKRVIIVSPSTLLVTLRTIQNMWQSEYQKRNAAEIARQAGDLYDKFVTFAETLAKVQKAIESASTECERATKLLTTGKGSITRRIEKIRGMGLTPSKSMPRQLLDAAEAEDTEENDHVPDSDVREASA